MPAPKNKLIRTTQKETGTEYRGKRSDDAEVSASATNGPEQVFIVRRAHRHVGTVGADQVCRDHVVTAQSMLAHGYVAFDEQGRPLVL